jgi:aryl-alcohol dehydrogenase-like predicted oxidoreductase
MQYRSLGRTGISISEIGFGAWGIGGGWGDKDDEEALNALRRAFDLGINFYDTALGYGNGHSEGLIAKAFRGRRDKIVIASKVPPKTYRWPALPDQPLSQVFPRDWIIRCTEQSLKNLNTEYLDLQQLHAWTDAYMQQTEWLEAFETLKKQGKIRASGVSANDWDPYGAVNLVKSGWIDSVQVIYNLFEQRPQEQLLPAALEHNVGILARVPFEEGLLTGKLGPGYAFDKDDWRANWLTQERLVEAKRRVDALVPFLAPDRPSLAALALKFILSHPAVSTTIPGMRKIKNVEENAAASDGLLLDAATLAELHKHAFAHGWAYPWSQAENPK